MLRDQCIDIIILDTENNIIIRLRLQLIFHEYP